MLWASQHVETAFQTQATREDIDTIVITLDGAPIRRINGGKPASQSISFSTGGQSIKNIPVGEISVRMEAFDAQKKLIGSVFKNRVQITAGKTTKLNLELKLIDEVNTHTQAAAAGHLEVNLNIVDGRKLTQTGAVIPTGGYVKLDVPEASPSSCLNGQPVYAAAPMSSSPVLPGLPPLNLQAQSSDIQGSSTKFLFKDIDLKADLEQELSGASACASATSGQAVPMAPTNQPDLVELIRQVQFLSSEVELLKGQFLDLKQQIALTVSAQPAGSTAPEIPAPTFTSADPEIATITPDGKLEAKEPGTTQVTVSIGDIQTQATVTVEPNQHDSQGTDSALVPISQPALVQKPDAPSGPANLTLEQLLSSGLVPPPTDSGLANPFTSPPPVGRLVPSATQITAGETFTLSAADLSGEIHQFHWQIFGAGVDKSGTSSQLTTMVAAPGHYSASLDLLGSDGQWHAATGSPIQLSVLAQPSAVTAPVMTLPPFAPELPAVTQTQTAPPPTATPPVIVPPTVTPPTVPPPPVYRYRATTDATQISHGHFSPDNTQQKYGLLFRLSVSVNGSQGIFTLTKLDGSAYSLGGTAFLQVGAGEVFGARHAAVSFSSGIRSITLTDTFSKPEYGDNWPKDYYVRLHLKDSSGAESDTWIGPLKIVRE